MTAPYSIAALSPSSIHSNTDKDEHLPFNSDNRAICAFTAIITTYKERALSTERDIPSNLARDNEFSLGPAATLPLMKII